MMKGITILINLNMVPNSTFRAAFFVRSIFTGKPFLSEGIIQVEGPREFLMFLPRPGAP